MLLRLGTQVASVSFTRTREEQSQTIGVCGLATTENFFINAKVAFDKLWSQILSSVKQTCESEKRISSENVTEEVSGSAASPLRQGLGATQDPQNPTVLRCIMSLPEK